MKPEEVFRFVNVRPAQMITRERKSRRFAMNDGAKTPLEERIGNLSGPGAREAAVRLARQVLAADEPAPKDVDALLEAANEGAGEKDARTAKRKVDAALGEDLSAYIKKGKLRELKQELWERLYAHTLVPEEQPEARDRVHSAVRAMHFLVYLAGQSGTESPLTRAELQAVRPTLPRQLIAHAPAVDVDTTPPTAGAVLERLNAVYEGVAGLRAAILDLENTDRIYRAEQLRAADDSGDVEGASTDTLKRHRVDRPAESSEAEAASVKSGVAPESSQVQRPVEREVVTVSKKVPWLFGEFGRAQLAMPTLELVAARKERLAEAEIIEAVAALEAEKHNLVADFLRDLSLEETTHIRGSKQFAYLLEHVPIAGYELAPVRDVPRPVQPVPGSPTARGIQPLGIGDLLVVKQDLMRYSAGEVAHIENVLKSEFKTRSHLRMREVEEIVITETEQLEETEKDLQTTERFELHKEAQRTIENQMSLEAGVSVTAGYGPVTVTAHADFALSQSTSEANKTASTFAKQVTERSVSRIMQRAREERMRRTLERFEEKNEHGFDNKNGTGHVIGVYRWVDKYYKARIINYGRRLMMEFIVPEPAAFYNALQAGRELQGVTLKEPSLPMASGRPLQPGDLTKENYLYFVSLYNVQDAAPYPAEVTRVSAAFAETTGTQENNDYAKTSEKLVVPPGYSCYDVFGKFRKHGDGGTNFFSDCLIAGEPFGSVTAAGLEGIIPISVKGWMRAFHVNVVAVCQLKPETKSAWQLKTYAAIMSGYERALADYNEQVAAAQIQAGVQIQGRNPALNRKLEQDELKKGALRLLTDNFASTRVSGNWRFNEMFDAMMAHGQFGYPEFHVPEAIVEGRIIQFFEQAFEWSNMTYRFYPYIWGRKSGWKDVFPLTDTDPQFTDFLRAGAARVIIPVHPPYDVAVLHYLATNEVWNGGDPPTMNDPLFVSIVDELRSDTGADIDETLAVCDVDSGYPCIADEWEVKVPTTLVYLQEDAKLPDFTVPAPPSPGEGES
jgi:hypothetical protein